MANRGKRAIPVLLGIDGGRHSPNTEPPKGVLVYADAKVNWFYLEGAFVLQSVHKRDHAQLEKDFDLYLKRPGSRGEICLNPERDINEYGIKKDDELEFRHKTLPISVNIDLYDGERRTVEVNSGYPVMDIVQAICGKISVKHGLELSLAHPNRTPNDLATQYQWLEPQSSLNGQGVINGDTLLLRKKFFILNDDIEEALDGNQLLCDTLYHQIQEMFLEDTFVGLAGVDKDKAIAQVSCYLHHIEQKEESISDEQFANKVIPKCRQKDQKFPSQLITVYYQERLVGMLDEDVKRKMLRLFLPPQTLVTTFYPVKIEEIPDNYVLVCHSNGIAQCYMEDDKLTPVDDREWRYINIRGANSTKKQKIVSVNALGSSHEFISPYSLQIATYITECLKLTKLKSKRNMQQKKNSTGQPPQPAVTRDSVPSPVVTPVPIASDPEVSEDIPSVLEDSPPQPKQDPSTPPASVNENSVVEETPIIERRQLGEVSTTPEAGDTGDLYERVPTPQEEEEEPEKEPEPRPPSPEPPKTPQTPQTIVTLVGRKRSNSKTTNPSVPVVPPSIVINNEDENTEPPAVQQQVEQEEKEDEKEKIPLTPVTALSFSPTLHIPEYFGLDFRAVLKDYRLFHVVVMGRDKRTILLNVRSQVKEIIKVTCETFNIQDRQRQKLWLPKGKKNILQKYGGKPKKRIGRFLRKTASVSLAPSAELAVDKTLEEQYDFEIKPLILHMHYKEPQTEVTVEDTDLGVPGHDEVDMGQEWPLHETSDVRSYRQFYQSWCGAIQGAYPITKSDAIRLAALLTHVYYGDRVKYKSLPLQDYDVKTLLPEVYCKAHGIASEVDKVYKRLSGKTAQECIIETSEFCSKKITHQGIFYEVTVPGHDLMFNRKKMVPQLFGVNGHGVFSVNKETGEVNFTHRFSDIYDWNYGENTFKLNFCEWSKGYDAYTYQREEILDTLKLYIGMTRSGVISQAPSRPPSAVIEDAFSLEEEEKEEKEEKMRENHLGLERDTTNSPQFSINITHSPESSPEPTPTESRDKQLGVAPGPAITAI